MGRIDAEVAAAVRAELFDRDDRGGRALGDRLFGSFEGRQRLFAVEGHRRAVQDQQDADQQRQRHQDTGCAFDEVDPEVSDRPGRFRGHRPENAGQRRHAAGGCDELEQHDDEQLREIGQSGFAAVMLQVAVHQEADAGIERLVGRLARVAVRVQRQDALDHEQNHAPQEPEQIDGQQGPEELFPVHLFVGIDAGKTVNPPFDRSHEVERRFFSLIYFCDVASERVTERDQQRQLQDDA